MTKLNEIIARNLYLITSEGTISMKLVKEVAKQYADYRVSIALELAAENAWIKTYDVEDEDKPEDAFYVDQECVCIDYDSILNIKLPPHE